MARTRAAQLVRRPLTNDDFLSTRETADMLQVSMRTLARWRAQGNGPDYRRFGRRVLYRLRDVKEWTKRQRVVNEA